MGAATSATRLLARSSRAGRKALHAALERRGGRDRPSAGAEEYGSAMAALARLRRPVDSFFDAVMVNAPEPRLRINRLLLQPDPLRAWTHGRLLPGRG